MRPFLEVFQNLLELALIQVRGRAERVGARSSSTLHRCLHHCEPTPPLPFTADGSILPPPHTAVQLQPHRSVLLPHLVAWALNWMRFWASSTKTNRKNSFLFSSDWKGIKRRDQNFTDVYVKENKFYPLCLPNLAGSTCFVEKGWKILQKDRKKEMYNFVMFAISFTLLNAIMHNWKAAVSKTIDVQREGYGTPEERKTMLKSWWGSATLYSNPDPFRIKASRIPCCVGVCGYDAEAMIEA